MSRSNERSLDQIKRDAEQARAGLTDTVEQLRSQVTEAADDLRHRISPEGIKAEVTSYFRSRGEQLLDTVIQAARDNPMQAVAVGGSVAYPLLRIVRAIPTPVLMVGAGIFLARLKTGQDGSREVSKIASEFAHDLGDRARELGGYASAAQQRAANHFTEVSDSITASVEILKEKASAAGSSIGMAAEGVKEQAFTVRDSVSGSVEGLKAQATTILNSAADIAAEATSNIRETAGNSVGHGTDGANRIRKQTAELTNRAGKSFIEAVQESPFVVAGIGLAIGGLIASCLRSSDAEAGVIGNARSRGETGFDAAKNHTSGTHDDVADADRLKEIAAKNAIGRAVPDGTLPANQTN